MPSSTALRIVGMPRSTRCSTSTAMLRTVLSVLIVYAAAHRMLLDSCARLRLACLQACTRIGSKAAPSPGGLSDSLLRLLISTAKPGRC